jgi:hypothetical protein
MTSKAKPQDRSTRPRSDRGQAAVELAFQIPLMLVILFGCVQLARVFYLYHTLQTALRGGAALIARSINVNYCNPADTTLAGARNLMVFGNLQGEGSPLLLGFTPEMIQIFPERVPIDSTAVQPCPCTGEPEGCDVSSGGRVPDFVVVNLGSGYPLPVPFPYVNLGTINLKVSVRMPVTGS